MPLRELASQLEVHAEALEAFPSSQRDELKTLALRLAIQAAYADEDCEYEPEVERILGLLDECILRIPHVAGANGLYAIRFALRCWVHGRFPWPWLNFWLGISHETLSRVL